MVDATEARLPIVGLDLCFLKGTGEEQPAPAEGEQPEPEDSEITVVMCDRDSGAARAVPKQSKQADPIHSQSCGVIHQELVCAAVRAQGGQRASHERLGAES